MKKSPLTHRNLRRLREAIKRYQLLHPGDAVLIGLSGGKDSLALVQLLSEVRRHNNRSFRLEAIHVKMSNIDYQADFSYLETFCQQHEVPFTIIATEFEADRREERSPCFLCSWTRRKRMFEYAQREGFNKLALGHHQDDILKTALMNLTFSGSFSTMPIALKMDKMPLTIIRPLCLCHEEELRGFAEQEGFEPLRKVCPYDHESTRTSIDQVLNLMQTLNPESRYSLWHALEKAGQLVSTTSEE